MGFFVSVKPCGVNVDSLYGPVPTGFASVNDDGLPALPHCDCGRIGTPAICCRLVYCADGNVSVTVLPVVLTLEICRPAKLIAELAFTRL